MEKLTVSLVIEILGKPADHVKISLEELVKKLSLEKGITITNKAIYEPKKIESSEDLFTSFAEIDAELESLNNYFGILFSYMPSHIEIISPEKLSLKNSYLSEIGNILVQRLHGYDAIAKNMIVNTEIILEKLKEISPKTFEEINAFIKKNSVKEDSSPQS